MVIAVLSTRRTAMQRLLAVVLMMAFTAPAWSYIDYNPTLGDIVNASTHIMVVQVDKVSTEKQVILFKKVADLKGVGQERQRVQLAKEFHGLPRDARHLLDWAQPGRTAILFHNKGQSYLCLGRQWYESFALTEPGTWSAHAFKSTGVFAYMGSVDQLRRHVADMLSGKEVVVTALRWDLERPYAQTAMDYRNLVRTRGNTPLWRIKASQKLYGFQNVIENKANIIGLGAGGGEVPPLVKALQDGTDAQRLDAATDLGFIGAEAKPALPALRQALKDKNAQVRIQAATALGWLDPTLGKEAAAVLLAALKEKDAAVRSAAVEALADIGPPAKDAVPTLIALLKDSDGELRWRSMEALGWMGPEGAPAVPALVEEFQKLGEFAPVIEALKRIGPHAKAAVPALTHQVKQKNRVAADILSAIGPAAQEAVPTLIEMLKDKDLYFTAMVAQALGFIGTPEAVEAVVPYCVKVLQAKVDASYHQHFAMVLGEMGPKAKAAVPALQAILKNNKEAYVVADALRKIERK